MFSALALRRIILVGVIAAPIIIIAALLIPYLNTPDTQDVPAAPPQIISLLLDNGYTPLGSADAPITLVEFGDYQCHFCNVFFHNTEEAIVSNFVETGLVRMVFRDFTIIGPDSITAAHGARCAEEQGLFWEYHDEVYSNWKGENNGWASLENLRLYVADAGLDVPSWSSCMDAGEHYNAVSASTQDARDLGLGGTPAFFVIAPDGVVYSIQGAQPFEAFESVFNDILN